MAKQAKKERWAAIYSSNESSWVSCQVITPNLYKTYQEAFGKDCLKDFNFSDDESHYSRYKLMIGLKEYKPTKLIILDHKPHPFEIIKFIHQNFDKKDYPELVFHLFGDFTLFTKEWIKSDPYLQDFKVKFICASQRQCQLVAKFLSVSENLIYYLPFPVDSGKFSFDPKVRNEVRKSLGFAEDKKYILYTGRLSAQKNINQLVEIYGKSKEIFNSNTELLIAGNFDDLGFPFFGRHNPVNYNYLSFEQTIQKQGDSKDSIHYLGSLNANRLNELYNACDLFFSLSLHNDEDYGMSPAEGLICGMPLVLTSWGGYSSFKLKDEKTYFIPVTEDKSSFYRYKAQDALKKLTQAIGDNCSDEDRIRIGEKAKEIFSIKGASSKLKSIIAADAAIFPGWHKRLKIFQNCFAADYSNPFGIVTPEIEETDAGSLVHKLKTKKIYREIYYEYTTDSETTY